MRSVMRAIISGAALLLICGCGVVDDERVEPDPVLEIDMGSGDKTPVRYFDEGETCLYADAYPDTYTEVMEPQRFEEFSRLAVTVSTPGCLSSTCDVDRVAFCDIEQDGNLLEVSSFLGFNEVDAPMCTLDCGVLIAQCKSEPLAAGEYQVVHGESRVALKVPSVTAGCGELPMHPAPTD